MAVKNIFSLSYLCVAFSCLFGCCLPSVAGAQNSAQNAPILKFEETEHSFGLVAENKGPVSHDFIFKNVGSAPLVISNVTTDCGCTTPFYPKQPIRAGEKGKVTISYDPSNRPGVFFKSIRVYTNAQVKPYLIKIHGNVITPGVENDKVYDYSIGKLQLNNRLLEFPILSPTRNTALRMVLYNSYKHPVTVRVVSPNAILVPQTKELKMSANEPKELILASEVKKGVKQQIYNLPLSVVVMKDNKVIDKGTVTILMPVTAQFTENEQLSGGRLQLDTQFDLGKAHRNKVLKGSIKVKNIGKGPLRFVDTYVPEACITLTFHKRVLAPNEESTIGYTIDLRKFNKKKKELVTNVRLLTNDAHAPLRKIRFVVDVQP